MKKYIVTVILLMMHITISVAQIGTWKNYLSYYEVQQIQEAGNYLFVQASNSLYQYNKQDQSITTYDKVNGLSDTYITHIKWCQQAKRLVAVYSSSNIDLVETNGDITNISAIYNKTITGDKTINSIYIYQQYAYLACGFGIVKINVKDAEISESYMLDIGVKAITIDGSNIYAQASDGTVWTALLNSNLIDKSNWSSTTTYPSFEEDMTDYNENINLVKTLTPGGPKYNYFYDMRFINQQLYSCGGMYIPTLDLNRPGTIQVLNNNEWTIYEDNLQTVTGHSYVDIDCIDVDPKDQTHLFASGRTGLYEFKNGKFVKEYSYDNSMLTSTFDTDKDYVIINALKYDSQGNLWIVQSLNNKNKLLKFSSDGQWTRINYNLFNTYGSALGTLNTLGNARHIFFDSNGYLWFVHDHYDTPALYRYDINNDTSLEFTKFTNQDGTTINVLDGVKYVTEDLNKNLWIGTSSGPLTIALSDVEIADPVFTQVKVPRNDGTNYADYLLSNIEITYIAVDGAGRKWFATSGNGVYLISADNMTEIHHFTTENSKLLSDNIQVIAINQKTGEVFFGTDKGLCSYISDAVEANTEMTTDNVWAFPNPVTPDYTGSITITGLTYNADVKILSANGTLIAEGRSNGGIFIWDGCKKDGTKVSSGIYMVATTTSDGSKGTVCKIAIVR